MRLTMKTGPSSASGQVAMRIESGDLVGKSVEPGNRVGPGGDRVGHRQVAQGVVVHVTTLRSQERPAPTGVAPAIRGPGLVRWGA